MTNITENNPPKWTRAVAWFTNPKGMNNDKKLRQAVNGKVVLITGASFGIGKSTAASPIICAKPGGLNLA